MKVSELKTLLQGYDDEMTVAIAYEYGNYYDTIAVEEVGEVFGSKVKKSSTINGLELPDDDSVNSFEDTHLILGRF